MDLLAHRVENWILFKPLKRAQSHHAALLFVVTGSRNKFDQVLVTTEKLEAFY